MDSPARNDNARPIIAPHKMIMTSKSLVVSTKPVTRRAVAVACCTTGAGSADFSQPSPAERSRLWGAVCHRRSAPCNCCVWQMYGRPGGRICLDEPVTYLGKMIYLMLRKTSYSTSQPACNFAKPTEEHFSGRLPITSYNLCGTWCGVLMENVPAADRCLSPVS